VLQLHELSKADLPSHVGELLLRATIVEENLGPDGLRIFYGNGKQWRDGGEVSYFDGMIHCRAPEDLSGTCDVLVLATDLAGNRSFDQLLNVTLGQPEEAPLASAAAAEAAPPIAAKQSKQGKPALPAELSPQAQAMRDRAIACMNRREFALAAARFEDALELAPDEPDLLCGLGSALARINEREEAAAKFKRALELSPRQYEALDGLALLAAADQRNDEAATDLATALEIRPREAPTWLRYGDILQKLGRRGEARQAWQKAADNSTDDGVTREKAQRRLEFFAADSRALPAPADAPASVKRESRKYR
jgi:tetratricopeptide (TPR) repeat protein